jgi:hypothetical protein
VVPPHGPDHRFLIPAAVGAGNWIAFPPEQAAKFVGRLLGGAVLGPLILKEQEAGSAPRAKPLHSIDVLDVTILATDQVQSGRREIRGIFPANWDRDGHGRFLPDVKPQSSAGLEGVARIMKSGSRCLNSIHKWIRRIYRILEVKKSHMTNLGFS